MKVSNMYVPPYESLLRSLNTSKSALEHAKDVTISVGLLKLLLQFAVAQGDFDEESYLRSNPDVRDAVNSGEIESGRLHYIGFGYFEGRKGGMVAVDESWYLKKYPDVAIAVKDGRVDSATQHFNTIGAGEGRSPSADQQDYAAQWKEAIDAQKL
jgi:hypothetical protein